MRDLLFSKQLIDSVDLTDVIDRLVIVEKWKKKHAIAVCDQYRNYLYLKIKYGKQYDLPPSKDIDDAWHAHILHTEDYMKFCEETFGCYLHHQPHTKKGILTMKQLSEQFKQETQELYCKEFGEYLYAIRPVSIKRRVFGIIKRLFSIKEFYSQQNQV